MKLLFLTIGNVHNLELHGLYPDLLKEMASRGVELYVVAAAQKQAGEETGLFTQNGVHILKVRTGNLTKCGKIERGISTLRIQNQFLSAIQKHLSGITFDLVLYSTPPITFTKVVKYIKQQSGARAYLLLKDIFPQNAVDLGFFGKRSPVYHYFRNQEKDLYKHSDIIGCMSEANRKYLIRENPALDPAKIEICPNGIEPLPRIRGDREKIRAAYGIPQESTVLIYGGNLGPPQGIDFLIQILAACRNQQDLFFVIAGSGNQYAKLKTAISERALRHVLLLPSLEEREYARLLSACDVGLIFLDKRFTIPNFPSRLLAYLEQGLPVLAATDPVTDIRQTLEENKAGIWVLSGDETAFTNAVKQLQDPALRLKMGENGRALLEKQFTSKLCCDTILKHIG